MFIEKRHRASSHPQPCALFLGLEHDLHAVTAAFFTDMKLCEVSEMNQITHDVGMVVMEINNRARRLREAVTSQKNPRQNGRIVECRYAKGTNLLRFRILSS